MAVHQIGFRLDDSIPYEASILTLLNKYPHGSNHQTAKALVTTYAKQGLTHPGANPHAAQDFYQRPEIGQEPVYQQPVSTPQMVEAEYLPAPEPMGQGEGLGAIEIDFGAL